MQGGSNQGESRRVVNGRAPGFTHRALSWYSDRHSIYLTVRTAADSGSPSPKDGAGGQLVWNQAGIGLHVTSLHTSALHVIFFLPTPYQIPFMRHIICLVSHDHSTANQAVAERVYQRSNKRCRENRKYILMYHGMMQPNPYKTHSYGTSLIRAALRLQPNTPRGEER